MPVDDEALGRMLEALVNAGGASESLPAAGIESGERMDVAQELLRRGWIDAASNLRGDGKLFAIREIRVTETGRDALRQLRAAVGRAPSTDRSATPLEEKRRRRLLFMRRLYELTNGSRMADVDMWDVGGELGWDRGETDNVVEYLEGEGLLEYVAMGGQIGITHSGVVEVEETLSAPDQATAHFPAAVNIIHIEQMHGSQLQQGTVGSTQEGRFVSQEATQLLRDVISRLRPDLADVVLDDSDRLELEAELGTVEQQLGSPRPKAGTIRTSVERVGQLLAKATVVSGSAVQLASHVEKLHEILPGI